MARGEGEEIPEEVSTDEESQRRDGSVEGESMNLQSFSLDIDTTITNQGNGSRQPFDWKTTLKLAFTSVGVVYGDLGTSPLYVLQGVFPDGIKHDGDILGALSLIFYSLIFISLIKYVFVVLAANDNGDGGTFALYSLVCRYAKVNLIPNLRPEDKEVSNYRLDMPNRNLKRASVVKSWLENSQKAKYAFLFVTMLGTSMVLGDGVLTPCISVLSAVGGVKEAASSLTDNMIMWISLAILILLFQLQRFGTQKVGCTFAPILTIWFLFIGFIGIYNVVKYDPGVIKAVNPIYIVQYFKRNKKNAWVSLGGILLCLTGSEALFADLGHFSVRSIQLTACTLLFPSVVLAYFGQASYLRKHNQDVANAFYSSVPKSMYWPMFVVAVLASIIASQSLISASFSIVQQAVALGCFPRVKVVHTSSKFRGQVYVPEINTILMLTCVGITLGFQNTSNIGNAFGIAVAFIFMITSAFLILVMVMIWKTNIFLIILYAVTIGLLELIFLSSSLYKFREGGYLPLLFALVLVTVMYIWNYGYRKKYMVELENKVSPAELLEIANDPTISRVPGLALFYTDLVQGISPIFTHYVANIPALHSVLVFVSIKSIPISSVPVEEQFVFHRIAPRKCSIFSCVVRYGYKDKITEGHSFERMLVNNMKEFIKDDTVKARLTETTIEQDGLDDAILEEEAGDEVAFLENAVQTQSIVYLFGENEVTASTESSIVKKFVIDYAYNWLSRCVRQANEVFRIPHKQLVKVGMAWEV